MTLNDILSITTFSESSTILYSVQVVRPDNSYEANFFVKSTESPDYTGTIWSKEQREKIKENKANLKKYGDYEVVKISLISQLGITLKSKDA